MTFVKRPVAIVTLSFFSVYCITVSFASYVPSVLLAVIEVLCASCAFSGVLLNGKAKVAARYALAVLIGSLAALLFVSLIVFPSADSVSRLAGTKYEITGTVADVLWNSGETNCYDVEVSTVGGRKQSFDLSLVTKDAAEIGSVVRTVCRFESIKESDGFDLRRYYLSEGIVLSGYSTIVETIGRDDSLTYLAKRLNRTLSEKLRSGMSEESGGVADAVLLGNREGLSSRINRDFSRIGISHLLAISGMHISFIYFALNLFLKKIGVGKKKIALAVIAAMIFYMFLTGFSASVVRAALVCIFASLITVFGVSYDGITALGICGAAIVISEPYFALKPSFQMSFCAFLGCIAAASIIKKTGLSKKYGGFFKKLALRCAGVFVFSAVVVAFSLPVSLIYFDEVSLMAPLSNVVFIPAFSVILYLSAAVVVFSPVPFLYGASSFVADRAIGAVIYAARALSPIRHITVSLNYPFAPYIAVALSVLIIAAALSKKKGRAIISGLIVLCLVFYVTGAVVYHSGASERIVAVRCGNRNGDAILIISKGKTLICDFSPDDERAANSALYKMKDECFTELDAYLMSSYPEDISQSDNICDLAFPKTVYLLSPEAGQEKRRDSAKLFFEEKGIKTVEVGMGEGTLEFNGTKLSFFGAKISGGRGLFMKADGGGSSLAYFSSAANIHPDSYPMKLIGDNSAVMFGSSSSVALSFDPAKVFPGCDVYCFFYPDTVKYPLVKYAGEYGEVSVILN
ncbi:MAG: ComEC/Rec2 family competence protein [Clostridia bacterium]|nr:ComEC/Rec2 family competence protein [Clostridia bacterium]